MSVTEILEGVKAEQQIKPNRRTIEAGAITYELLVAKNIKRENRGWDVIDTVLIEETQNLDEVIQKVKVTPTKVKSLMTEAEKEYFTRVKAREKKKTKMEAIKEDDPVEKLKKEIEDE